MVRDGATAAPQLDVGVESLRTWTRQARIDTQQLAGVTSEEQRRIVELEREVRELRRANEILKAASAFFARSPRRRTTRRRRGRRAAAASATRR